MVFFWIFFLENWKKDIIVEERIGEDKSFSAI